MFLAAVLCKTAAMCYDTKKAVVENERQSGKALRRCNDFGHRAFGSAFGCFIHSRQRRSSSVSDLYAANLPVRLAYLTLSVLMARWVIEDIFIASIPDKYSKAFNKAVKIKARYSFWQRLTQSYIREHLPQVYIKPYRSYMRFKRCVIVYYLLVFALLIVAAFLCDGKTVSVMWKVVTGIDVAISLFLLSRFDINRCTKFTRSK